MVEGADHPSGGGPEYVAEAKGCCIMGSTEANARLIAAAPELLAAAVEALNAGHGKYLTKNAMEMLNTAIRKAEGNE